MAITFEGDTVDLAGGSVLNIRPSAGELWILKAVGAEGLDAGIRLRLSDGVNEGAEANILNINAVSSPDWTTMSIPLDIDDFAVLFNTTGGLVQTGYRALKL